MARKFLTSIDLNSNELQHAVIWKLASAPISPTDGLIYYNTTDNRFYIYQDIAWKDVTGRLDEITTTTTAVTIGAFSNGSMSFNVANANGSNDGLMPFSMYNDILDATSSATPNKIVERDANGDASFNVLTTSDITIVNAPQNLTDGVNKQYVDNLVSSGMRIIGNIDCSTNPLYPAAVTGDAYYVSVDGLIGGASGEPVQIGDLILAVADNGGGTQASVGSSWIVLENNIGAATETVAGYIRIATQTEANDGINDSTAITPLKLATYVATQIATNKHAANIGDGLATTIAVTHPLATTDINVTIKDNGTLEQVEADVIITDTSTVNIGFSVAPTSNQFRVIIAG